jgi:membrane protease YdiL (CAAX protease family)
MELRSRTRREALGVTLVTLGASNVVTNVWLPAPAYVPWNVALAYGLTAIARSSGVTAAELGADRRHLRCSAGIGAIGAAVVAAAYGFSLVTGVGAAAFKDDRVTSLSTPVALWTVLVRIPIGTVLVEEVLFRGVLPALLTSTRRPHWLPAAVSSGLFGLWHVLPSLHLPSANVAVGRLLGERDRPRVATGAVLLTALAGGVFHSLRMRTRHLAAPVLVHLATNVFGFLGARFFARGKS